MKTLPTPLSKESFAASLLVEYDYPPMLPDDITAARLAARSIHNAGFWSRKLDDMVKHDVLIKLKCINPDTRRPITAYRPQA